jgi:hypothetical protein
MTFQQLLWIHAGGLSIFLGVSTLTLRRIQRYSFSTSFAIGYAVFIAIAALLYFPGPKDAQAELYWLIPGILTIPASLLLFIMKPGSAMGVAIVLSILGTIQYWGIGLLIDWLMTKRMKAANKGLVGTGDPQTVHQPPQP